MKVRMIILALGFTIGVLFASCSASSKTCPAYSDGTQDQTETIRS